MIFLAYRYVNYIKNLNITQAFNINIMTSSTEIKIKKKNIMEKEIEFLFAWSSCIFNLTYDGQDTIIVKFTYELFLSTQYDNNDYVYGIWRQVLK